MNIYIVSKLSNNKHFIMQYAIDIYNAKITLKEADEDQVV